MDVVVRQIGCASRDEELIPVGSIYVDPRSYASPFKVHDLRIAHVTRVSNVLRFINFDTSRKISGKDLQQLVDETKHHISLQEVQGQLALVFQRENTEISRILLRCDEETDEEPDEDNHVPNMIYVNGNTTIVQIFMTQYRNVIAFTTPLTDDNIQYYVNNLEDVSSFLIKLYDKKPIVLDDTDGKDTEEDECGQP